MIHVNKIALFLFLVTMSANSLDFPETEGIIHNEVWDLEGRGDTLWVLNPSGLNYTLRSSADTLEWTGFKGVEVWANISFGAGILFMRGRSENSSLYNPVVADNPVLYSHEDNRFTEKDIPYVESQPEDSAVYQLLDSEEADNKFYCATGEIGLLIYDIPQDSWEIPGWPEDDTRKDTALSVAVMDSTVLLSESNRIYLYNTTDESWDSIKFQESMVIYETTHLSDSLIAMISSPQENDGSSTQYDLHIHDFSEDTTYYNLLRYDNLFLAPATDSSFFVCTETGPLYMRYTEESWNQVEFPKGYTIRERMEKDNDIINFEYRDILYMQESDVLWIGTSKGLFRSRNETAGINAYINDGVKDSLKSMEYIYHLKPIKNGLEEAYAYPSIINNQNPEAVFAYRLKEPSEVTIDIFDFNMDHVVRIIDSENRSTGGEDGHSTKKTKDKWDGYVEGKKVAPGIYYFRIKTDNRNRAFGKIIIAK